MSVRSDETEALYQAAKRSRTLPSLLDEEPIHDWQYWKLVENRYPHDKLVEVHHMAVLKREADVYMLDSAELQELWYEVLPWADKHYDFAKLNFASMRSINAIPHIHLCVYKESLK